MLGLERILLLDRVRRDSDDSDTGLDKILVQAREVLGFGGVSGGVPLGIEIEYEFLPLEIVKCAHAAAIARQVKVGRPVARRESCRHNASSAPAFVSSL